MNLFNEIQARRPKKNKFNLSHEKKLTMKMGDLVPILVHDILPGDTFKVNTEMLIRMQPLAAPMYQRVKAYTHYFFVPRRLVFDQFKEFITGGDTGVSAPQPPHFYIQNSSKAKFTTGSLQDYMGLPSLDQALAVTDSASGQIDAAYWRAYALIYNEYFRDQTLTPEIPILKTGGDITDTPEFQTHLTVLRKRSWQKDYFTSASPQAQKGGAVMLPTTINYSKPAKIFSTTGHVPKADGQMMKSVATDGSTGTSAAVGTGGDPISIENIDSIATTINDLRTAARLQEWLEKNMRGGSRYIEQILHHFGVKSSDARLQRPEYLGGGNMPIVVSEVLTSFQDAAGTGDPVGSMAGHGIAVGGNNHGFKRTFEEHGIVIGIMSVLPLVGYQQGIPRHFQRFNKLDYAWPEFGNLGEQEIKLKELYYAQLAGQGAGNATWGFQSRYAEYKSHPNTTHGLFRTSLAYWHQNRIFAAPPALNANFIQADPTDRIYAVQDGTDQLLVNLYNSVDAIRPLPYFGTPTL